MSAKWMTVAKWEFFEKVRSKAFLISLVLMPVIIFGIAFLPTLFVLKEDEEPVAIGVIDKTGKLLPSLQDHLNQLYKLKNGDPNYVLRNLDGYAPMEILKEKANNLVIDGAIEGYFYFPPDAFENGNIEYRAKNVANIKIQERFSRTIEKILLEDRLKEVGIDTSTFRRLQANISLRSMKVSEEGGESESGFEDTFIMAYIGIFMIVFMVITSGQLLVRSLLEEKSNRVIEVLLSSCSSQDLMVGKIIGLSGLGLLQMFVYGGFGIALSIKFSTASFELGYLLLIFLYAILGYLFYAAILVAAGSPVTTEQEAQQINSYIGILLVVPIGFLLLVMQSPNSLIVKALSYIPFFTSPIMVMRMAVQMPSVWEIILTNLLLVVSTIVMMWIAGRVFRMAILSYGKRPSLKEFMYWLKQPE